LNGSEASTQNSRSESIMFHQNGEASIRHKLPILTFHLSAETLIPPSSSRSDSTIFSAGASPCHGRCRPRLFFQ
jgi:hypothetical protein